MKRPIAFVEIERLLLLKLGQHFLKKRLSLISNLTLKKPHKLGHRNSVLEVFILACIDFCNVTLNDKL